MDKPTVFAKFSTVKMEPGQDYVFRYRFYVHEGKLDVEQAERLWYDFAEPPTVKVQKF